MNKTLKDLRIERKITQKYLSSVLDVSTSYISRLENGYCRKPHLRTIAKLIEFFDCSLDDIYYAILNSLKKKNKQDLIYKKRIP